MIQESKQHKTQTGFHNSANKDILKNTSLCEKLTLLLSLFHQKLGMTSHKADSIQKQVND